LNTTLGLGAALDVVHASARATQGDRDG
jgi:hypothetical protein